MSRETNETPAGTSSKQNHQHANDHRAKEQLSNLAGAGVHEHQAQTRQTPQQPACDFVRISQGSLRQHQPSFMDRAEPADYGGLQNRAHRDGIQRPAAAAESGCHQPRDQEHKRRF